MQKTVVLSVSEVGWTVYRVRTTSSQYHLGVFGGMPGRRKCAVLRGRSQGLGRDVDLQDSAPLIGGKSLFDVPPPQWIGQQLEIGTATTSPIQSVEKEHDPGIVTSITSMAAIALARAHEPVRTEVRAAPAPQQQAASEWAPYPEGYVERVEIAAKLLRATYQKTPLIDDLRRHPELFERFQLGLGDCLLMLKAIGGRMTNG